MSRSPLRCLLSGLLFVLAGLSPATAPAWAQREFGFDNSKPSGQPYLKPEESVRRMKAADGFEVKLFAAEPQVKNPIAMTVDEKGRVWVVECYEYPKRTAKGKMPRDRILILEDTDGDGVCDKVTVFAEGKDFPVPFDLASGIEVGNGGVYLGAPPYLFFIENKNDKAGKIDILLKGFGSQDTHETLNTFQWGPDGWLYGLQGVFTHSDVKPAQGDGPATRLNAAVWRYNPPTKKFEIFAEGTSNPWGIDWRNTDGQFVLACCVIPHLFHISPGGTYKRQAGQSFNPYAYGEIKEICDHTFHRDSGWAHAGLISLDTPLMPPEYRNSVVFGSIHGCSIKRNVLKRHGSTYTASRAPDFLVAGDKNFRPINLRWGPNGEIYCIDWHDQNPCHQAGPDSWDYEHGRVYRIQTKGLKTKKAVDLGKKSDVALARLIGNDNPYVSRTASRLLRERERLSEASKRELFKGIAANDPRYFFAYGHPDFPDPRFDLKKRPAALRALMIRLIVERTASSEYAEGELIERAVNEPDPAVRLELASAAIRIADGGNKENALGLLHVLASYKEDARDPVIPQMLWLAYERQISLGRTDLQWLIDHAAGNPLLTDTIVPRTMRRLAATGKPADLNACVAFLGGTRNEVRRQAVQGLATALKGRQVNQPAGWPKVLAELLQDKDQQVQQLARQLAVNFHDPQAIQLALKIASNLEKSAPQRVAAIQDLALTHPSEALDVLLNMVGNAKDVVEVRQEACRALGSYDDPKIPSSLLAGWKNYPTSLKNDAVNVLAGRKAWAGQLLDAVGKQQVARADLTNNTILRIQAFHDKKLTKQIGEVWGQVRDTPAELNALINKMRGELDKGRGSFARGRKVFENSCAKCHKFDGFGHDVGPALDGAGRDIEYLLVNVLDPNRVVGQPYFIRIVELKDGRIEQGLLAAEDEQSITLKGENNALKVIQRKEIEGKVLVSPKSMMPEGLDKNLTVQDFRDLVRYVMVDPFLADVKVLKSDQPFPGPKGKEFPQDWKPTSAETPVVGVTGRIPLSPAKDKRTSGEAGVWTEVVAPKDMNTQLVVNGAHPWLIFVNDKLTYEGKPFPNLRTYNPVTIPVPLQKGRNRIQIQVTYYGNASLFARFHDPNRQLRYPE